MVAVATLPSSSAAPQWRPGLAEVRPDFAAAAITGGRELSLTATAAPVESAVSVTLPGAAVQLRNLVDGSGNPVLDSVLGPVVDGPFNSQFGPAAQTAAVPLQRIDFSGYGASSFSSWVYPNAEIPAVVQTCFELMVGRPSHEVVQVKSVLYPWGAIVVRTITIDRQDDNTIDRHDSGWVAATAGVFEIPGFTIHPGAVLGAFNIRQIADTTQTFTGGSGAQLVGVYFDADLQIDGVTSATTDGLVPSVGQFGFVQTGPVGGPPVSQEDLGELIASQGPLAARSTVRPVAGTAQAMRLTRVEVDNAFTPPFVSEPPQFAVAARGSVVLPPSGSWSVLQRTDNLSEPTAIDPDRGVPLIQQGPAGGPASTSPWRLAEPADLWVPESLSMDYRLLHATDSTRVLFPRPVIAAGATAFTSDQVPLLADAFALINATGIFPRQERLPDVSLRDLLAADQRRRCVHAERPTGLLPAEHPQRTLATGSAGTIAFEYDDGRGTPSQISVAIDPSAWSFSLAPVNVRWT